MAKAMELTTLRRSALPGYITELEGEGFDFHIHALGDGVVRESLDATEYAQNTNDNADTRHRLTHLEMVHGILADAACQLSPQDIHCS